MTKSQHVKTVRFKGIYYMLRVMKLIKNVLFDKRTCCFIQTIHINLFTHTLHRCNKIHRFSTFRIRVMKSQWWRLMTTFRSYCKQRSKLLQITVKSVSNQMKKEINFCCFFLFVTSAKFGVAVIYYRLHCEQNNWYYSELVVSFQIVNNFR